MTFPGRRYLFENKRSKRRVLNDGDCSVQRRSLVYPSCIEVWKLAANAGCYTLARISDALKHQHVKVHEFSGAAGRPQPFPGEFDVVKINQDFVVETVRVCIDD